MLNNVLRRVTLWNQVQPFYPNSKDGPTLAPDSRATESVLNAVILSAYDQQKNHLTDITRSAFDNMWALQIKSGEQAGAWGWQNFHLAPWESSESQYCGAALAAIAVGRAPDNYHDDPRIQENLRLLRGFLRREYATQPLLNKVYLLWASARLSGLLNNSERTALVATLASKQQPDGGWSLSDLGTWKRRDDTPLETKSDGLATGLTVLALEQSGLGRAQAKRGLAWLAQNQIQDEGKWPAWSLNKKRDPDDRYRAFHERRSDRLCRAGARKQSLRQLTNCEQLWVPHISRWYLQGGRRGFLRLSRLRTDLLHLGGRPGSPLLRACDHGFHAL